MTRRRSAPSLTLQVTFFAHTIFRCAMLQMLGLAVVMAPIRVRNRGNQDPTENRARIPEVDFEPIPSIFSIDLSYFKETLLRAAREEHATTRLTGQN
jgi:hypothetical protein